MSTPIIIVLSLCVIAAFFFGFVAGINLEYHTSKKAMQRQQEQENQRLREIAEMAHIAEEAGLYD